MPNKNAKGDTEVINETNIRVIGYEKEQSEESEEQAGCPNCQRSTCVSCRQVPDAMNAYAAASFLQGGNYSYGQLMNMNQ